MEMNLWYVTFDPEAGTAKSYLVAAQDVYTAATAAQVLDAGKTRTSLSVRPGPGPVDNWQSVEDKIESDVLAAQPISDK